MAAYTVRIQGSDSVECLIRDHADALNTSRAVAIAVARIRVGAVVEVWAGKRRRLAFVGRETTTVTVGSAVGMR